MKFFTSITLMVMATFAYSFAANLQNNTVRLGVFNSQESAQAFYKTIPNTVTDHLTPQQLWLSISEDISQFSLYYLDISDIETDQADSLCAHARKNDFQCQSLKQLAFIPSDTAANAPKEISVPTKKKSITSSYVPPASKPKTTSVKKSSENVTPTNTVPAPVAPTLPVLSNYKENTEPVALLTNYQATIPEPVLSTPPTYNFEYTVTDPLYADLYSVHKDTPYPSYSFDINDFDTVKDTADKQAYQTARDRFLSAVQNIGAGVNAGNAAGATQDELIKLGQNAFENASNTYLNHIINFDRNNDQKLANDAGVSDTFLHHVKKNFSETAQETAKGIVNAALSGKNKDILAGKVDALMLSGARGIIDASLSAARKSDLYLLRNLELEYNLNDFKDSYISVLGTQPIHQSDDFRHNIFLQGSAIINEQSVDINDDTNRHTVNLGAAYRYLTPDEQTLLGANVFFDHQWPYHHSRVSVGVDAQSNNLSLAANYYTPVTGFKNSRTDAASGNAMEETALQGYDVEIGYDVPQVKNLKVFGKGYQYFRDDLGQDDLLGLELSAEYNVTENFRLRGAFIEENGGRDGVEIALQYSIPLYDVDEPNLALAEMKKRSMRSKIFDKVRRENRIRVGERINLNALNAEFSALSTGLPFDVGGTLIGAGIDIDRDTPITIPNGDFGIITFSNGAVANVSASGVGDVILEYNATTLTVTATNGGFVQFISGSGGIQTVNVPGGVVNLLGTDIDFTDDGTTTTIQVRAGAIDVVPAVGVAVLGGSQSDIVSLGIATGTTSLLTNPALETRQEAAFTSLDLMNPSPVASSSEAPFINVLPELITGPQFIGNNADLRLTFTQPVTVTGVPQIDALVGATLRNFFYDAGASSSTQIVFRHAFVAGDVGAASITTQNFSLAGGTIVGSSNGLNALTAFTDTTLAISDSTAPSLVSSIPTDGDGAASAAGSITLNFDENIQAGIGNIFIFDTTDGSDNRVIPITDPQVSIVGSTATITLSSILELVTDYDIVIASGVLEDTLGNPFAGLTSGDLNFTTANGTVPMFASVTPPTDGTYTNGSNLDWTVTYDQAVTVTGGTPTIGLTLDSGPVTAALVSGSGTANLVFRHTVTGTDLDIDGVVLANTITPAGATLVDTISLTQAAATDFTAFNPATPNVLIDQAPTLSASTPIDNATGESIGSDVTLTFNENIQAGTGNIIFTDTDDGSGDFTIPVGDARVSIASNVVTIDLSAQLFEFNTNYEITTAAGVFEDTGVLNLPHAGITSGDVNWQTVIDPTNGFPAVTVSMAPGTSTGSHENAQDVGTWQMLIDIGATPDGVIFESGATGQGIAASFNATDLVFAAGDGAATATGTDSIFGTYPIASISQGLHHFVFVANPDAAAEIGLYIDGIRVITESIAGGMQSGEWAGTDNSGYGIVGNSLRAGVDNSALSGATLSSNLSFYTNTAPASF